MLGVGVVRDGLGIGHIDRVIWSGIALFLVKLDVHLPRGVLLLEFVDEVVGEGLVALHGDEGVTKEIESSPCDISLDDSK